MLSKNETKAIRGEEKTCDEKLKKYTTKSYLLKIVLYIKIQWLIIEYSST